MSAKTFEYILLLDDIVIDQQTILGHNIEVLEQLIEDEILPNTVANRYTLREVTK